MDIRTEFTLTSRLFGRRKSDRIDVDRSEYSPEKFRS